MRTGEIPSSSGTQESGESSSSQEEFQHDKSKVIRFMDGPGSSMKIKTQVYDLPREIKEFIRESIQYTFPDYKYTSATGSQDEWENWFYTVSGNYKQYVTFGRLLSRFGYPVDELRKIVADKKKSGRLSQTEWEGRFDSDKEFQEGIEKKLPDSKVDLYDEQKFGVAFLSADCRRPNGRADLIQTRSSRKA